MHPLSGRSFELAVGHLVGISLNPASAPPAPVPAPVPIPIPIPVAVLARVTFPCLFIQTEAKSFCYNARDWTHSPPFPSLPSTTISIVHNYVHQHPLHPLLGTSFHDSLLFGCWCCCCACRRSKLRAINHFVCPLHPFIQPERPKEQPHCRSNGLAWPGQARSRSRRRGIWPRGGNGLSSKRSIEQDQFFWVWGGGAAKEQEWRPGSHHGTCLPGINLPPKQEHF